MAGDKQRPTHRITRSRKDGDEIDFTDFAGNDQTRKYAPFAVIFPGRNGKGGSLAFDKSVDLSEIDPSEYWFNVYENEPADEEPAPRKPATKKPASKPKAKTPPPDDDEDGEDFDDSDIPY